MLRKMTMTVLALAILVAVPLQAAEWSGWITDDQCGAKGAQAGHTKCALKCVSRGASLVLYDTSDKKLYELSDQEMATAHAGENVKVVGTLDGSKITVQSITKIEPAK
jgi:hypothetical protein